MRTGNGAALLKGRESGSRSWLCPDDFDRTRLLDMQGRIQPVRRRAYGIILGVLVLLVPETGWYTLLCAFPAVGFFTLTGLVIGRVKRPEYLILANWMATMFALAAIAILAHGPPLALLSWLGIPVLTLGSRFSLRGVVTGVGLTAVLVTGIALLVHTNAVLDAPVLLVAPLTLVVSAAVLSTPIMQSDIEHRSVAVIDPLTGMFNRHALEHAAEELSLQSELRADPVGIVVIDLDHFKRVNDTFGHTAGDDALRAAAELVRSYLRAFDRAYRIGGEELMVLLPGVDVQGASELATRLHDAVAAGELGTDVPLTMSFGVAASRAGERFDYDTVFAAADSALYRAKEGGRNRVCVAAPDDGAALSTLATRNGHVPAVPAPREA